MSWVAVGADISSHQYPPEATPPPDFAAYKAGGQDLVIVKATQGATYVNPGLVPCVQGAHAAGVSRIGVYHWPMPGPVGPQVANFLRAIEKVRHLVTFRAWFDYEEPSLPGHASLDEHRRQVQADGLATGTYTYPYYWRDHGSPGCAECAADPLWWACYARTMAPAPRPWPHVSMWQYAGTSVLVPGLPGRNDHNRLLVDPSPVPEPDLTKDEDMAYISKDPRSNQQWLVAQDSSHKVGIYTMQDLKEFESDPRNVRKNFSAAQLDAIPVVKK